MSTRVFEFVRPGEFDDVATAAMGNAFDAACKELHDKGQSLLVREVIVTRIIEAARRGERDPIRLREIALAGLDRQDS